VIVSFGDKATEDLFHNRQTQRVRRYPPEILRPSLQKLDMLNSSRDVKDLQSPPGNRLELLKGDLKGYYSVRINERWRLVFRWQGADAHEVQIMDYHRG
jgi:proteic killer suppression protein